MYSSPLSKKAFFVKTIVRFLEKVAESKPKLIQFWTKKAYDREKH
ncbi:phosphoenolpyruvate carboxylase [Lactobacillus delbrueckii subsp. bulgaricus]|nr:phosphoenolpyruvate carboxylase [Lactobacillus delbrueckii subsp. bulgaricus]